jgi:hypothetical protein
VAVIGGFLTTGLTGIYAADASCKVAALSNSGFDIGASGLNTAALINIQTNSNDPTSLFQSAAGDFDITNYASAKSITIQQAGNGSIVFGQNGAIRAKVNAAGFNIVPLGSATPSSNGDLAFEATSNTSVKIKLKGSDGVVREAQLTLS